MTGRPAAFSAFALASTASVADSAMAPMRREMRVVGVMRPSSHGAHWRRRLIAAARHPRCPPGARRAVAWHLPRRRSPFARFDLRRPSPYTRLLGGSCTLVRCARRQPREPFSRVPQACRTGPAATGGQWLNWQSTGLQNRRLGVRVPPALRSTRQHDLYDEHHPVPPSLVRTREAAIVTETRAQRSSSEGRPSDRGRTSLALFFRQVLAELRK